MIRHKDYLLVQVEQHAERIKVNNDVLLEYVTLSGVWTGITLPPGSWQLIGLAAELTEEQWREMDEALRLKLHMIDPKTTVILKLIQP